MDVCSSKECVQGVQTAYSGSPLDLLLDGVWDVNLPEQISLLPAQNIFLKWDCLGWEL